MSYFTIFSSARECCSFSASMKLQIVGTILLKPLCHPSARLEDQGSPQLVASKEDVPSQVYSMYSAKPAMSARRRGLRCLHAMSTSSGGTKGRVPIIWKDFRTSDPTTWYSGTRSVLENFLHLCLLVAYSP